MTFRWIDGEELALLDEVFESRTWTPITKDKGLARVLICEGEDGRLLGFNVVQLCAHVEPLWVAPGMRGRANGLTEELANRTAQYLRDNGVRNWRCTTSSPRVAELCESNGMVLVEGKVFRGGC